MNNKALNPAPKDSIRRKKAAAASGAKPKIQDVATLAGVSLGAVSAVLNSNGRISAATRKRVQLAIARLGYRPNLYASNLARRQTRVLGLVISNLQNPFFSETAQAIEEEAERHNYEISLMSTNFSRGRQRAAVERLLDARVAGIAVITSEHDRTARKILIDSDVPSVLLDAGSSARNSSTICVDSQGGMYAAVRHLIELGHRDILFVRNSQGGSGQLLSHKLRDEGFVAAARACVASQLRTTTVDMAGPGADAGERAIASMLGQTYFTAVVAVTDLVAMGVYRGLQAHKLRIPQDVSVVGFDDTYFSRFLNPPLTTVNIPRDQLSHIAVRELLETLPRSGGRRPIILGTDLIVRGSTAPPNMKPRRQIQH